MDDELKNWELQAHCPLWRGRKFVVGYFGYTKAQAMKMSATEMKKVKHRGYSKWKLVLRK